MKKFLLMGIPCLILLLITACTSTSVYTATTPHLYTHSEATRFEILGEVIYESNMRVGFVEFLRVARNTFPETDYVIDIMVDRRVTTTTTRTSYFPLSIIFFFLRPTVSVETDTTWIMRGTAIRYIR